MAKGGKRPGAGRKPHKIKGLLKELPPDTAALILADMDAAKKWRQLADSTDQRIVLDTLKYLTDRAYGKPRQDHEHGGRDGQELTLVVRHIVGGDGFAAKTNGAAKPSKQ